MSADQLARALEDAISSLTYIANTACKRDEELMADAINVRGYARSRATAAEQALAAHRAQGDKQGEAVAYYVPNARACQDGSMEDGPGELVFAADASDYAKKIGQPLYASPHQVAQQWIAVGERMPDPGINVLACFRYGGTGRAQVVRAMHAPQFTCSEDQFGEFLDDGGEYDEKTDATYWPEGWYESNEAEETSWRLHEEVTHWLPLPSAPTKEQT